MRRRLTTAFLLVAFLAGGGLRPGVNPTCPHHGGDAPAGSHAEELGSTGSPEAGVAHAHAGPAGIGAVVEPSADHDDGEGVPCSCGSACQCVQPRVDHGLVPATLASGPLTHTPSRRGILPPADETKPRDRALRLLPWPTGPPTL